MTRSVRTQILVAALFCSTALATPAQAQYNEQQTVSVFYQSTYTYCDAAMLGMLWGSDAYDGKIYIGGKILAGNEYDILQTLAQSRARNNKCEWGDVGYSYQDATTLARHWGMPVYESKLRAALMYTDGQAYLADRELIMGYNGN